MNEDGVCSVDNNEWTCVCVCYDGTCCGGKHMHANVHEQISNDNTATKLIKFQMGRWNQVQLETRSTVKKVTNKNKHASMIDIFSLLLDWIKSGQKPFESLAMGSFYSTH